MKKEVECGECLAVYVVEYNVEDLDDERYEVRTCCFCGNDDISAEEIEE